MNPRFLLLCLLSTALFPTARLSAQARSAMVLSTNNISARINMGGDHFWDLNENPYYRVPKVTSDGIYRNTIYASALWIGGISNGNLHLAAMTYRQTGSDFYAGAMDTANGTVSASQNMYWDKMWRVTKEQLKEFQRDHSLATSDIREWPAHGRETQNEGRYLAPFVDVNGDGEYNWEDGDYPAIKGDEAIWWVMNDQYLDHRESYGRKMGIEVHGMAYAYDCPNTPLDNTIFLEYTIINRSKTTYDSVFIGNWTDLEIGNGYDDYAGSDTLLHAFYGYNADGFDETIIGYKNEPPKQGVVLLNKPMTSFITIFNDMSSRGNPMSASHYYSYLNGREQNGGCITNGTAKCYNYAWPGDPGNLSDKLSEMGNKEEAGNRRGLAASGPYTLMPGEQIKIAFAYVTNFEGNYYDVSDLKEDMRWIRTAYNQGGFNNCAANIGMGQPKQAEVLVYPNPAQNQVTLVAESTHITGIILHDMMGRQIKTFAPSGVSSTVLDLSGLQSGTYHLLLQTPQGNVSRKVVIVK